MNLSDSTDEAAGSVARAPVLSVHGVTKSYGGNRALDDASFSVQPGSVHGLLGGNGSGKSTLIKILAGVVEADAGRMHVRGNRYDLASHSPQRANALGLRFVHQQNSTFSDLTVEENLAIARGFETGIAGASTGPPSGAGHRPYWTGSRSRRSPARPCRLSAVPCR